MQQANMILVTGTTGQVGSRLVSILTAAEQQVRAVVEPGAAPAAPGSGLVERVEADFADRDALMRAAEGADRVFMLVPPSPLQPSWQQNIVDAASSAELVVKLSAFDSGPDSRLTMGRWHHEGEQALRRAGLPHVILRPQYFVQNLLHDESALRAGVLRTFIPPGQRIGMVDALDVAAVAAAVLMQPPVGNQIVVPTGPRAVSTADVAQALSAALGVPVRETYLPPTSAMAALLAAGRPDWHAQDTIEICQTGSPHITDTVQVAVGRPPRDIVEVINERFAAAVEGRHG